MREQVRGLREHGWTRFKIPIALPLEYGRDRLLAAREAAGEDAWVGMDAAWIFREVDDAVAFLDSVRDARLGWFEDVFPPGDAAIVADLRARAGGTRIAMGDEQGGSYYPEALLLRKAVDVVRIDLTCMGGITRARPMIEACQRADTEFSAHMFAHVHSQVFGALGYTDVPIEWGVPGSGVDQFADSLRQPVVRDRAHGSAAGGARLRAARERGLDRERGRRRPGRAGALADELTPRSRAASPQPTSACARIAASASSSPCSRTSDFQVEKAIACPIAACVRRRAAPRSRRPAMSVSRAASR